LAGIAHLYGMALMKKELFICDRCGMRKRLPSAARHWCDNCDYGGHHEMRPAREKKLVLSDRNPKEPETPIPTPPPQQHDRHRLVF
jgi:hypothetical protein